MDKPKSKFPTMETSAAKTARNASAEGTAPAKLVKKKGAQAGDPYAQPVGKRSNKKATSKASYGGIKTSMPTYVDPAAGLTQANGRIVKNTRGQAPNFNESAASL
jgi:hypothetical protein